MSHRTTPKATRAAAQLVRLVGIVLTSLSAGLVTSVAAAVPASAQSRGAAGSSMETAAASCWEIKQLDPAATDGVYWLVTPVLTRPMEFYCDMTTDGGGWVLIGRGREGWRPEYEGLGSVAEVRDVVDGPGAFRTRQLSSKVVDGLLGGGRVDALPDGIRLRRAASLDGSVRQEVRFQLRQRDRWVWTFRGRHPLKSFSFDGTSTNTTSAVNTLDFGTDTAFRKVNTDFNPGQAWYAGWSYGIGVTGVRSDTAYLWSATDGLSRPMPFTQMYLRPKLLSGQLTYPEVPESGLPALAQHRLAETRALRTVWGVSGLASGPNSELRTEVQAFAQIGSTMYVGGNFKDVQRTIDGADRVTQSYLAAFDVNSGEFLAAFRPTFNDQIKTLTALPNGRLAVGGEFNRLNGVPVPPLVVLDPVTGQQAPGFVLGMRNGDAGAAPSVRSAKVGTTGAGDATRTWLYLGGVFTHVAGGGLTEAYSPGAARVDVTTGAPDKSWTPIVNGSVNDITPSQDGTRVYLAGFISRAGGVTMTNVGVLSTAPGAAVIPFTPRFSLDPATGKAYQWVLRESEHRLWQGGSQHSFFSYDKASLAFSYGGIALAGGDFQTATVDGDVVYGGCHCIDYLYSGVDRYGWPSSFDQGDKLGFVGAWDEASGRYLPEFDPILDARGGYGAWASVVDSNGVLWIGGSFTKSINVAGTNQWSGGFMRFAPRDAQAPAAPSGLSVAGAPGEVTLRWTGIAEAGVDYEVLENGRVVAVTTSTSALIGLTRGQVAYAVRAVDRAGNRSASTPPVAFDASSYPDVTTALAWGSTWAYRYDATPVDTDWAQLAFDAGAWAQGPAPLGFGTSAIATVIHTGDPLTRPITAYFRRSFQVPDPASVTGASIDVLVNDGAVVYLNGTEIGRQSMPTGTVTATTYATTTAPTSLRISVPAAAFQAGENVLAVETHLNYRSTRDIGLDARVLLTEPLVP